MVVFLFLYSFVAYMTSSLVISGPSSLIGASDCGGVVLHLELAHLGILSSLF